MIILIVAGSIAAIWVLLTLWADSTGAAKSWFFKDGNTTAKALIVFDPDPFYNLDEQVCLAFARKLNECGFAVTVYTVAAAANADTVKNDLYVFCANTYNWAPDHAVTGFIKEQRRLKNKNAVAITLGSGSTDASKRKLDELIIQQGANLVDSRAFWLMRPNDESRMKEANTDVAVSMVAAWAAEIGTKFAKQ